MKYKVAIIGCGAIFDRHYESINKNKNFELVALCDVQKSIVDSLSSRHGVEGYYSFEDCIENSEANFYVIATPNSKHYDQVKYCIENNKHYLVEKPACLKSKEVKDLISLTRKSKVEGYCVLQVRLNESVSLVRECLERNLLGKIRGVNLVQRWQRPVEYFSGWRSIPEIGGGTLHEVGIHYIDILQNLFGRPEVSSSKVYNVKHINTEIEDTIYALLDFEEYGGTLEVTIAAEPLNLECSLSILGSNGYLKLGGKALNLIESYNFLSNGAREKFENLLDNRKSKVLDIAPNDYGSYLGSCPNHTQLYDNLDKFKIENAYEGIKMIEDIYQKCGRSY